MKKPIAFLLACILVIGLLPGPVLAAETDTQVETVELKEGLVNCFAGDTVTLTLTVTPDAAANLEKTWTSSNADVVQITDGGMIHATGIGSAKVTVTVGEKSDFCNIVVHPLISITVTEGALAQLFTQVNYYSYTEFEPVRVENNAAQGTDTYFFRAKSTDNLSWRVSMDGKLTKAGYWDSKEETLTVLYSGADAAPTARLDYTSANQANSAVAEDSVLVNVNSSNHLVMEVGDQKTLKAYRAWEIIRRDADNYVLMPDFHYTVLSGNDVIRLEERKSPMNGDSGWRTLTALREGVAVIEVTYDAIDITGGSYPGLYGASDPFRTGLIVVQVGGSAPKIDFGIQGYSGIGTATGQNISYNPGSKRAWDAEFDTLYFTESSGQLKFRPAGGTIQKVSVSNDKGNNWTDLTGVDGLYTATIVPGNNILRVQTTAGTAYQVVRGDPLQVSITEVRENGKSDGDGTLEAGETVRVRLQGLHMPVPKMAGNYNPGYTSAEYGKLAVHLNYSCGQTKLYGPGTQYTFITAANYLDVKIPDNASGSIVLTDGYIGFGVMGYADMTDSGKGHRTIPDEGCGMLEGHPTLHTRSILPEITILLNSAAAANSAPVVKGGAVSAASIRADQNYAINPEILFTDPDGDTLTFTVSENGGAAKTAAATYKYSPGTTGTHTLTFTASDGKAFVRHTITLTVTSAAQTPGKTEFGLTQAEIAGYAYVSFEDNGVRVKDEKGLLIPAPLGTIVSATRVPFKSGETVAQVTLRLLDSLNIGYSYTGTPTTNFYLSAIKNVEVNKTPYASIGEFDAGVGSGWMITQNGVFINKSAGMFTVNNNDTIRWQYTCQLGADIGDTGLSNGETTGSGTGQGTTTSGKVIGLAQTSDNEDAYLTTGNYLEKLGTPSVGSVGGEWMVIGLIRSGRSLVDAQAYYEGVETFVRENINEKEQLHRAKSTENSRLILALTAMGKNITDVAGHDLLAGLADMDYVCYQGINGPIWALIAFDCGNYPAPKGNVSRDKLIRVILEAQLSDGGWALSGEHADPDMTGMAVQALAPYSETDPAVKAALEKAITALSEIQDENGGYSGRDGLSSESNAQVIVALTAMGIDPDQDARFIKNGHSVWDALLDYYVSGGGFRHVPEGELDGMATEQSYYAMTAYYRMKENKPFLYDMTDVIDMGGDPVMKEIVEPTQIPAESAEEEKEDSKGIVIGILTGAMILCAAGIVIILLNRKKHPG